MDFVTVLYILIATIIISLISLISVFSLYLSDEKLTIWLPRLIVLAIGVLLGDAFLHLIPDAIEIDAENVSSVLLWTLVGIIAFFFLESILHRTHDHNWEAHAEPKNKPATFGKMNLLGDGAHNFVDGILIASSFLVDTSLGITTTIAIALHEVPQEISDVAVLIHSGYTKKRAIFLNFLCATMCIAGGACTLLLSQTMEIGLSGMLAFTAGGFIYIATSDLIPLLQTKKIDIDLIGGFVGVLLGILAMQSILWFEHVPH